MNVFKVMMSMFIGCVSLIYTMKDAPQFNPKPVVVQLPTGGSIPSPEMISIKFKNDKQASFPKPLLMEWLETIRAALDEGIFDEEEGKEVFDFPEISLETFEKIVAWIAFLQDRAAILAHVESVTTIPDAPLDIMEKMTLIEMSDFLKALVYLDIKNPINLSPGITFSLIEYTAKEIRRRLLGDAFNPNAESSGRVKEALYSLKFSSDILKRYILLPQVYSLKSMNPVKNIKSCAYENVFREVRYCYSGILLNKDKYTILRTSIFYPKGERSRPDELTQKNIKKIVWGTDGECFCVVYEKYKQDIIYWTGAASEKLGKVTVTLPAHGTFDIKMTVFDPSNFCLATIYSDGVLQVFKGIFEGDIEESVVGLPVDLVKNISSMALSQNADKFAIGLNNGSVLLYTNSHGGLPITTIAPEQKKGIECIAINPFGDLIAWITGDGIVNLYDARIGKVALSYKHRSKGPHFLSFSADGLYAVSADKDAIRVINLQSKEMVAFLRHRLNISSCTISPKGEFITVCSENQGFVVFNRSTLTEEKTILDEFFKVYSFSK